MWLVEKDETVSDQLFSPSTASQPASRRGRLVESRLESSGKERQNNHHLYPHYQDIEWQIFFYNSIKFASLINLIERSAALSPCKLISAKNLRCLFLQLKLNNL